MEVGHVGQNVSLQAVALNMGTVMIGAFDDQRVKKVLEIEEEPLYIIPVGKV
jgi:nitroreductase